VSTTTPPGPIGGLGGAGCMSLLVAAIFCGVMALLAIIVCGCTGGAVVPMDIAAIVWTILSLGFFALWVALCVATSGANKCSVLSTVMNWISGFIIAQVVVIIFLGILGGAGCAVGGILCFGYYGLVLALLWQAGRLLGCWH
jgi:hypothetical protein